MRRGPLARLLLRITRPVTAARRTPELAREHGTAPWRLLIARIATSRPVALPIAIVTVAALVFAASCVRDLQLGLTFIRALPADNEVRAAPRPRPRAASRPGILVADRGRRRGAGHRRAPGRARAPAGARRPASAGVAAVIGPRQQSAAGRR